MRPSLKGAFCGLGAAVLFGSSMPLAKTLLSDIQPFLLAGLFYLGSGLGLGAWYTLSARSRSAAEAPLRKADLPWLVCAILFGGILAELLLMFGLQRTTASEASLLLNLEGAFSALIAWVIFKENANARVLAGMVLLTGGAMLLSVGTDWRLHFSLASICVVAACLGWAIDNNLTRRISHADPIVLTALKGLVAGAVSTTIGMAAGGTLPPPLLTAEALAIGLLSYGASLVLFIFGMRHIGTARTSAYFSAAPFIGALTSLVFLHEQSSLSFWLAAACMATGIWLHLTEHHEHSHVHEAVEHEHTHTHDEHHQHVHDGSEPPGEPHSHRHLHEPVTHSHPHHPDIHHRHDH
jgi:drug/metabolite transporter (DMT)-like permease